MFWVPSLWGLCGMGGLVGCNVSFSPPPPHHLIQAPPPECEALPALAREGCQGAEAAPVSRGTVVPLLSHSHLRSPGGFRPGGGRGGAGSDPAPRCPPPPPPLWTPKVLGTNFDSSLETWADPWLEACAQTSVKRAQCWVVSVRKCAPSPRPSVRKRAHFFFDRKAP